MSHHRLAERSCLLLPSSDLPHARVRNPMTYRSLRIFLYPTGTDVDLENYAHELVQERSGPQVKDVSVFRWAKDRNLEIAYVDNCWIRVPVTRDQVVDFLLTNADPIQKPPPEGWQDSFTCDRYVIEEEEF